MKKIFIPTMTCIVLLIGAALIMFSTNLFYTGFHNLDTAQNMASIEQQYGIRVTDIMSDGNVRDYNQIYILGGNQQRLGFLLGIIGGFMIGVVYVLIASMFDELTEKVKYLERENELIGGQR